MEGNRGGEIKLRDSIKAIATEKLKALRIDLDTLKYLEYVFI